MGHGLGLAIGHGDSDSENLKKYQRRPLDRGALLSTSFQLGGQIDFNGNFNGKMAKINKMAKNHFSRSNFGSQGVFLGVLGASLY